MLFILYVGIIVSGALCMHTTGVAAVVMSIINYLFSSSIFPIAQHAKTAASLLAASMCGATFGPFAQHAAALTHSQA